MTKQIYQWVVPFLPSILVMYATQLKNKDANSTGADDAIAEIMIAAAPLASADFSEHANATLKAMRAIEQTARNYRAAVGDPTL